MQKYDGLRYKPVMEYMQSLGKDAVSAPEDRIPSWTHAFVRTHDVPAITAGYVFVEKALGSSSLKQSLLLSVVRKAEKQLDM